MFEKSFPIRIISTLMLHEDVTDVLSLTSADIRPSPLTVFTKPVALALDGFALYCPLKQSRKIGRAEKLSGFEPGATG